MNSEPKDSSGRWRDPKRVALWATVIGAVAGVVAAIAAVVELMPGKPAADLAGVANPTPVSSALAPSLGIGASPPAGAPARTGGSGLLPTNQPPSLSVQISAPRADERIEQCVRLAGTVAGLPANHTLKIVIRVPDADNQPDNRFFPHQPIRFTAPGYWHADLSIATADDVDRPYWIQVYTADQAKDGQIPQTYEWSQVPSWFALAAEVKVWRKEGAC